MRSRFDEQLALLHRELIEMGALCEEAISTVSRALSSGDAALVKKVAPMDQEIDRKEREIESLCLKLLLQQQPVARDLRQISAALKMVTDMERIGDHAADISELTVAMAGTPYKLRGDNIKRMAAETIVMLVDAVDSYVTKDMAKARAVIDHDDVVDDLFLKVKADLIQVIRENPEYGEFAADLLMVNKYLERIGDHATNLAEWVIFALDNKGEGE